MELIPTATRSSAASDKHGEKAINPPMQLFLQDGVDKSSGAATCKTVATKGTSLEMAADDPADDFRALYRKIAASANISVDEIRVIFGGHCFDGCDEGRSMKQSGLSEECTLNIVFMTQTAREAFWKKWCP